MINADTCIVSHYDDGMAYFLVIFASQLTRVSTYHKDDGVSALLSQYLNMDDFSQSISHNEYHNE